LSAQYLIRLDDACDTMDRNKWHLIERVLDQHAIKPIVAVIPDNRDPALVFGERDEVFWNKVRTWAMKGWTIGMHGHTHVMHSTDGEVLVPFYARSEFVGLSLQDQAVKIRTAWQLFLDERIVPEVWVAPAHSFDVLTLEALRAETSIRVVSDGIAWDTYYEHGFHWIPQQMWRLAHRRTGLWTVCLHPNDMSEAAIASLDQVIAGAFRDKMTCFRHVHLRAGRKSALGCLYHEYFWWRWRHRLRDQARG
jgi:predicted deacetylase